MDRRLSLSSLQASGAISPVDVHLTNLAARLTNESRPDVQLAMALASQWPQRGHVCVDLAKLVPDDLWESQEIAPDEQDVVMPQTANWIASLKTAKRSVHRATRLPLCCGKIAGSIFDATGPTRMRSRYA